MATYTVYHIPGVKFGCTNDIKRRLIQNKRIYGEDTRIHIFGTFTDIQIASDVESFYNKKANYRKQGHPYTSTMKTISHHKHSGNSQETRDKISKSGTGKHDHNGEKNPMYGIRGEKNSNFGTTRSKESKERMSVAQTGKHDHNGEKNPMYGRKHSVKTKQLIVEANKNRPFIYCPHCEMKSKNRGNMNRYHLNNCKHKGNK